jgi:hypothetical protein
LLLHANYFGHPLLITCLDIFFNALLYTGIMAFRRLLRWLAKTACRLFPRVAHGVTVRVVGEQEWSLSRPADRKPPERRTPGV